MRLALIGLRGSGKTTVGRLLAQDRGLHFVDLDDRTAAQFGERSIHAIWDAHGETAWRAAEVRALREVLRSSYADQVISLGGGTPTIPQARELLIAEKQRGLRVVYLKCPAEVLSDRLKDAPGDRPSITGQGAIEEVSILLAQREPMCEAIADVVLDATGTTAHLVREITRQCGQ